MSHVLFLISVAAAAFVFALLEIQIEGPNGWAAQLPTWRIDNRWTRFFCCGRQLTGYHLYAQSFVLLSLHLPFTIGLVSWSWRLEARVLAFLVLFWIAEDFFWFVVNPAFGVAKFRKECIWWHAHAWWWIMPKDYWLSISLALILYFAGVR